MHLVARAAQNVTIPRASLELRIERDEPIWTESSYKYEPDGIARLVALAGFGLAEQWVDDADRFALTLAVAI